MPVYAFYIGKKFSFRGSQEEFGNVYHFQMSQAAATADDRDWGPDAIAIKNIEKAIYGSIVQFDKWRVWGPTEGGEDASLIRDEGVFTAEFGNVAGTQLYRELAVVCNWPIPRSVPKNRKRYLRKYHHVGSSTHISDTAEGVMSSTGPPFYKTNGMDPIIGLGATRGMTLCNERGAATIGPGYVLQTFRGRQLKQ
jgi:hypothetical protein